MIFKNALFLYGTRFLSSEPGVAKEILENEPKLLNKILSKLVTSDALMRFSGKWLLLEKRVQSKAGHPDLSQSFFFRSCLKNVYGFTEDTRQGINMEEYTWWKCI